MRRLILSACAAIALAALPVAVASSATAAGKHVIYGKDVPVVLVAEWDAGGKMMMATGKDDVAKAPKTAVKYTVKTVKWPTATVRVYEFKKADGGVLHAISDETQIYVVKGSLKATVGTKTETVKADEIVAYPSGVLRSADIAEDTSIVTWDVKPTSTDDPVPTVVRLDAATAKGGTNGETYIRRYPFPGNSVRYAQMFPNRTMPNAKIGPLDSYFYYLDGHVQYSSGGEAYQLRAGDFLYEQSGSEHDWDQKEGARFLATSGLPLGVTQRLKPSEIK